jgi:hypothetical protein
MGERVSVCVATAGHCWCSIEHSLTPLPLFPLSLWSFGLAGASFAVARSRRLRGLVHLGRLRTVRVRFCLVCHDRIRRSELVHTRCLLSSVPFRVDRVRLSCQVGRVRLFRVGQVPVSLHHVCLCRLRSLFVVSVQTCLS